MISNSRSSRRELVWREVVMQRPYEMETLHDILTHLASLTSRGMIVWEARCKDGQIYPEDITPRMYWGARAIITDGRVELLPDRQSFMAEDGESKKAKDAFLEWINDKALPIVNYHVSVRNTYHIDLTGAKEGYRLIAEDRGSGGYLYIGAYALKPED